MFFSKSGLAFINLIWLEHIWNTFKWAAAVSVCLMFGLRDAIFFLISWLYNPFISFCLVSPVLGLFWFLKQSYCVHTWTVLPFKGSHISCSHIATCHLPLFMGSLLLFFYSFCSVSIDWLDMAQLPRPWTLGECGNVLGWSVCWLNGSIMLNSSWSVIQFHARKCMYKPLYP